MEQSPRNLSKFLGQIVKALSFTSETDKTDSETIQPENVQPAEEALEHSFDSGDSTTTPPNTRLLVFRSEDAEVRKILFDSLYVTDEGHYLHTSRQKDCKFLKDTVVKFAFGDVPLRNPETIRFAKFDQDQYAFAVVFNLPTSTASTTPSPRRPSPFHDSSTDSTTSSSGYSSLPILDDHDHNQHSSSPSSSECGGIRLSLNPSHSLPTTPSHFHHQQGGGGSYYRCRNSSRITLGAVLLFSTQISPSLLEPLLLPMQAYISQMYHLRSRSKFPTMLKSYYNCLNVDIQNYARLVRQELPEILDILPLFSLKIFSEFISLLVSNPWSKINVICTQKGVNSGLAIFKICYLIKNFKRRFPLPTTPNTSSTQQRKLSSESSTSQQHYHNTNNPESNDSGYFSCSTINKSSLICDRSSSGDYYEEEEEEQLICDNRSNISGSRSRGGGESSCNSSICEEKEEVEPRNKFYLGDEEDDEQTESKLALSEPMKEKLFPNAIPPKPIITVQHVPLDLEGGLSSSSVKDENDDDIGGGDANTKNLLNNYHPKENIYYLNNSSRFSPFQTYQLFHTPPNYDYIHTITNEILEINLDKLLLRSINMKSCPADSCKKSIRELVSKTRSLTKLITDTDKTLLFFLVNLIEIIK